LFKKADHDVVKINKTLRRRANLRDALIEAADKTIAVHGLKGLRARSLAFEVGCAVGAIYNVVNDIDDLIFAVNERTLQMLEDELATSADEDASAPPIDKLVRFAVAYLNFAADHGLRWRAIFEHSMSEGGEVPEWYRGRQRRLFSYLDQPLSELAPDMPAPRRAQVARSMFSAVHGLVALGLDEKVQAIALPTLREQVGFIVTAIGRGLTRT
jgi:AcrR family transcriptional regulator